MNFEIRKIEREDFDSIAKIYVSSYACMPWQEKWQYQKAYERIADIILLPKSISFLYQEDNIIKGCICCVLMSWHKGYQLEGKELFVDPIYQNNGIGKKLLLYIEHMIPYLNVSEFFFWTMRTKECDKLVKLYNKLGFQEVEDRIIMTKNY